MQCYNVYDRNYTIGLCVSCVLQSAYIKSMWWNVVNQSNMKETTWKGKYRSTDNTKIGKEKGNSYRKNEEISGWEVHKTHGCLTKCFHDHRCLSRSEESKCMWTSGNDGATWEFLKNALFKYTAPSLPLVHMHLLSSDRERHLWSPKYIIKVSMCLGLCDFHLEISSIFGKNFPFLFLFVFISLISEYSVSYYLKTVSYVVSHKCVKLSNLFPSVSSATVEKTII